MGASRGQAPNNVFGLARVGDLNFVDGPELEGWGRRSSKGQENHRILVR